MALLHSLQERYDALLVFNGRWAKHDVKCEWSHENFSCNCGYNDALRALNLYLGAPRPTLVEVKAKPGPMTAQG